MDDTETLEADGMASSTLAVGRMQGYMLNLGLRPTPQSRLELRREISQLTYAAAPHAQRDEASFSSRVSYAQHFDNCLRFQSGYSMAPDAERLDLKLARNSWDIRLSHAQDGGSSKTPEAADANSAIRKALSNLATAIQESKAAITVGPLPTVSIPEVQLQQIFQNLIANAIKYRSDADTPRIHVRAVGASDPRSADPPHPPVQHR